MKENTLYSPGSHVLLDFYGAQQGLCDIGLIEQALRDAAAACQATVLDVKLHRFGEASGVTGLALLAESHISIHTWPETQFVALDVFVCGDCDASLAVEPLKAAFLPKKTEIRLIKRGSGAPLND